jgi:hypothetical protein
MLKNERKAGAEVDSSTKAECLIVSTNLINTLLAVCCGWIRTKFKTMTKRQEGMKWWNNLSPACKTQICDTYTELVGSARRWETLTGREIEMLFDDKCKSDAEIIEMAFSNENKNRGTQKSPFGIGS